MKRNVLQFLSLGRVLLCVVMLLGGTACSTLPPRPDCPMNYGQPPASRGLLLDSSEAVLATREEGQSAFVLISDNAEALRWRLALIDEAQSSIDLQVFIWSDDESGRLLLSRIITASRRGVKVRLLLDDIQKDWSDRSTAFVSHLPNVSVRRFNPGRIRKGIVGRTLQMGTQFRALNRRMHNKQLIVDGHWGIIGGRNIGNPYFGLGKKYNNRDLDVLITGHLIRQMADDFNEYWNADAAYPGEAMSPKLSPRKTKKELRRIEKAILKDATVLSRAAIPLGAVDWSSRFAKVTRDAVTGVAVSLSDSPIVNGDRGVRLVDKLESIGSQVRHESCVITPYMIPSKQQLETIERIVREEQQWVRVLVPSMESNNRTMAHSHYKKYRKRLLEAGVELYEFRGWPSDAMRAYSDAKSVKSGFISLHAKAFVLDRHWVLLGSLNVDPRSVNINTEHMIVIDSPKLAERLLSDFDAMTSPENAWRVSLTSSGKLRWTSTAGVRKRQPARGLWQRCSDWVYRWLPIEGQL
jgi:putative cardiolipin synthase